MALNLATGQWEDDEHPNGGAIGDQIAAPVPPMPPPPSQAPGPEQVGTVSPLGGAQPGATPQLPQSDDVLPPSPGTVPGAPAPATPLPTVQPAAVNLPPPIQPGGVVSPAEAENLGAIDKNTAAKGTTAQQQGQLNTAAATAKSDAAWLGTIDQARFIEDRQRIADDAQKQIAARQKQADTDYQAYKNFGLKDPDADKSFGRRLLEAIAIGLGAYASGINKGPNQALEIIQNAAKDNIDRQKAQQEKLFQIAQASGKDVDAAKAERDDAFKQLDLKHSALLESSAQALRAQLAKIGVPQAQIDANQDIQKLEGDALQGKEKVLTGIREDETAIAKANIAAAARKAKAGAGAPKGPISELAQMKQDGADPAAIQKRAEKLHIKPKDYLPVIKDIEAGNKPGGGGVGSVRQNAVLGNLAEAERAVKDFKPGTVTTDTINRLQQNEERSKAAKHSGESGVLGAIGAAGMRAVGAAPRGPYDGIPEAQQAQITNAHRIITHLTEMQQGKNIETLEQYLERYDPYRPGLSPEEVKRREAELPKLVAEQRATQDPQGIGSKRLKAVEGPDPRIAKAQQVLSDPEMSKRLTPAERAYLLKTVRGAKKPAAPTNNGGTPMDDITL